MNLELSHAALALLLMIVVTVTCITTLLWVRKVLQRYRYKTYRVSGSDGIEILESVNINGVEQWIHVRGRSRDNPILLFIHGGPGATHIGLYDAIQRPWENYFTVIQWDQRQAGKSQKFWGNIEETISHQQYIDDAEKMIAYIRERFSRERIFLMATSYGTYLSMHVVKRKPEWFFAYVPVGQVMNVMQRTQGEHRLLLEYAEQHGHTELAAKLESIAPYPDPKNPASSFFNNIFFLQEEESRFGKCYPVRLSELIFTSTIDKWMSPHYSLADHFRRSFCKPVDAKHPFANDFMTYDLPSEVGMDFEVPILLFTGVHDFHCPRKQTDEWFDAVSAPYKEHVLFDHSAHAAYLTEPGEFLMALVNKVLPFANHAGQAPEAPSCAQAEGDSHE